MTVNERAKLTKSRWLILAASCFINLCIGSLYAWSVFGSAMTTELNGADLAIVFSIANAVGPITMIPGGSMNDKIGPKWMILIGGLMFGAGMFFSGFAGNKIALIISYGLGCGLGMGMVYGCTISNSVKFFPDKKGLIGGIATASYGISSVLIPLIARPLMNAFGVRSAFKIFGIVFLAIICGCAFLIKKCPDGFMPEGFTPAKTAGTAPVKESKNWKQMLSSPIFYVMILLLLSGAVFGLMATSSAKSMAVEMVAMGDAAAVTMVSVLALFNAAGRVVAGFISDKIGRINTITIAIVLAIIGLIMLFFCKAGTAPMFVIAICILGLCFGTFMGVYPGFVSDQFGPKYSSVNYGIMFIGFSVAGIVGPMIVSNVHAATGAYNMAFLIGCGLALVGLALSFVYRVVVKKTK